MGRTAELYEIRAEEVEDAIHKDVEGERVRRRRRCALDDSGEVGRTCECGPSRLFIKNLFSLGKKI